MTAPTVLLLVLVYMWKEQRGCSSLMVHFPVITHNNQEDLTKPWAAENTIPAVIPGQNAQALIKPHTSPAPGLTEKGKWAHSRRRRSWQWNQFFVIEEYRGPEPVLIGRLHTDLDRGDGRTKYILEGEGVGSVFVIDGNTGNIHVTKSLDREEKDQYRLIATATDRQTGRALEPSSTFIIRVQDINDNPPVFTDEPYSATVPEMANIGTSIIQVTATDADDPTYGNSARLVYAVTQGQLYFSVDPQTGVLRTAVPDMDRESQDMYLVVLEAKDMGGHLGGMSGTTTVTVSLSDVNDNPPQFRKSVWSFSISELAAPGVEVGRLSATDADMGENALLDYTILDGEGGRDMFNITGRDQEAIIVLNKLLDYETRSSYSFSVEVVNPVVDTRFLRKGPFKDRATVRVMVLNADEPPRFSRSRYRLDVSENCPPVCSVGRVSAVDPDTGQSNNIRYSIDPQSDPEALFRITSDSGLITTVMELDREREQWHNITVIATQRDNPNLVTRVVVAIETLDQNDNAPELDRQYTTSVCDSSSPGQVVQVVRAVDRDQGGQDSTIHFSLPPESSSALNLTIRESGGATASLVLQSALKPLPDLSSLFTLYVPVVLRDGASGLTNTGTVTVTVCPCLRGGMRAEERGRQRDRGWERQLVCLPLPSASPSLIFSMVTLLVLLAFVTTLLVVCALSLSLRHQKRDSHSPFEEDDVRENIITYDDEGGGEADTAAFDITALQSIRTPQSAVDPRCPGSAPVYGRLCYSIHALPGLLRDCRQEPTTFQSGLQLAKLMGTYGLPANQVGNNSPAIQNQDTFDLLEPGAVHLNPAETWCPSRDGQEGSPPAASGHTETGRGVQNDTQQRRPSPDQAPITVTASLHQSSRTSQIHPPQRSPPPLELPFLYAVGKRDLTPQLLTLSGGMLGYGSGWGIGKGLVSDRAVGQATCNSSLPVRMEEFLKHRLDQVTFDLSQPPYDSLQTYEFEGGDSRAGSLSSLESEGQREEEQEMESVCELDPKFQRLVKIIEEREQEEWESSVEEETPIGDGSQGMDVNEMSKTESTVDEGKQVSRWDF
uniref:Cadherin domain-containing protein n=1 Tax=Esox lucius TaxID=8010 RepID=A0A6Q2Y3T8_ESOLU